MKERIIDDLKACKIAFSQAGIPFIIIGGTVLGYARYNDIMEWDTDLDIGVTKELNSVQWSKLYSTLRRNGFKLNRNLRDFNCGRRKASFNLWFWHKVSDSYYESYPEKIPGYKYVKKAKWLDSPLNLEFLEDVYPMPNHLNDYLESCFGADWKTNIVKHDEYVQMKRGGNYSDADNVYKYRRNREDGKLWWPVLLKSTEKMEEL
jgi:phosphorylcholine metabolism protein LicD